jgi:hypothetical protein
LDDAELRTLGGVRCFDQLIPRWRERSGLTSAASRVPDIAGSRDHDRAVASCEVERLLERANRCVIRIARERTGRDLLSRALRESVGADRGDRCFTWPVESAEHFSADQQAD